MVQLEFSTIADSSQQLHILEQLVAQFQQERGVQVQLTNLDWEQAWSYLLVNALHGSGPHVSHIGSTWGTSLGTLEALRPFSAKDLKLLGAPDVFWPSLWHSAAREGGEQVWSIPWTAYAYLMVYRRDVFARHGLDEKTALATPAAIVETVQKLQEAELPWVSPSANFHLDILYTSTSWVWGEGGELVDGTGRRVLFAEPQAIAGYVRFFEQFRYLKQSVPGYDEGAALFRDGKASLTTIGTPAAIAMIRSDTLAPGVRENLGFHVLPGIPWVGGDNLAIWKHIRMTAERAALDLVRFLIETSSQVTYQRKHNTVPARQDVLDQCDFPDSTLTAAIRQTLQTGRSCPVIRLWSRIEYQLAPRLEKIVADIHAEPQREIRSIVEAALSPLAKQLNLVLSA